MQMMNKQPEANKDMFGMGSYEWIHFLSPQSPDYMYHLENDNFNLEQIEGVVPDYEESGKEKNFPGPFSVSSEELLWNYPNEFQKNNDEEEVRKLSTEEIVRLAGEKYIQFSTNRVNGYTTSIHPYISSPFSSLSMDETREVELVYQLLTAADKVDRKQYALANKILTPCAWFTSIKGSPVERLVFYFAEALRKRIERETGNIMVKDKVGSDETSLGLGSNPTYLAWHQNLPFTQVLQFTGMQAIIDHVGTAEKIHLIDLNIRSGVQWTAFMQALAEQKIPNQLLNMTVIGTREKHEIEETGKRLMSFAQSLSLAFSFKTILLSDMKELKEEDLNIEDDEVVAVYSHTILRIMISRPDRLEHLIGVMGKIKPAIIVVAEVEANRNSNLFVNRFTETLFHFSALFDCLEACMARDNEDRMTAEGVFLAEGIQNIVSTEGEERTSRSVKINVWRLFFERFKMVEVGLSESSLSHANLVCKNFPNGDSCSLEVNGKCLIVGWKGSPLFSLSTWKFM